jgi:hypothetical protein
MTLASVDIPALPPRLTHPEFEFAPDEPAYDPDIHLSLTEPILSCSSTVSGMYPRRLNSIGP